MSSRVSKLFRNAWFQKQSMVTKLLYIYLTENSNLNTVGVFVPNIQVICIELGISLEELRESVCVLIAKKLLYVQQIEGTTYFIVPSHFQSLPKSTSSIEKVNKALSTLPTDLVDLLKTLGINTDSKVRVFKKPTEQEVSEYSLSLGHLIDGKEFIRYYDETSDRYGKSTIWVDGRGTEVKDWKAKLKKIWCKDENKIKTFDDAPEGFKSFYVLEKGVIVTPDGWRNGKPYSKNLTSDILIKREYERRISSI